MLKNYLAKLFAKTNRKFTNFMDLASNNFADTRNYYAGIESYQKNVIVFRCVNLIAQSASHVPWVVSKRTSRNFEPVYNHSIITLLKKPNPEKAGADFFSEIIASKLLFGNSYILAVTKDYSTPRELYLLPATATEVVLAKDMPIAYRYNSINGEKLYPIDHVTRMSKILHIKNYHPTNPHYGLSYLNAAASQINLHSEATNWNYWMLKNGARPSGALILKDNLTEDQFERLQQQLREKFTGSENSGKPLMLEGGLDWKEMSISPKDMDFIESKNSAAREIALTFGVPPQLLGINGDNT